MLYNKIKKEYDNLSKLILSIQKELRDLPSGKLVCCHQGNASKWYHCDENARQYIPKSNRFLAELLARKKYLTYLLEDYTKEQNALGYYLRHHSLVSKSEQLLIESSEYKTLLSPYFKPLSQELDIWMNSPYETNTNHLENRIYKGIANNFLRSKSEVLIDMLLRTYNIPFRYECALTLGNITLFPDFTARHPKTGNYYYWEHFGMMDDHDYIKKATSKINLYATHEITPGIQLITTYETKNHPLTPEIVKNNIELFFT